MSFTIQFSFILLLVFIAIIHIQSAPSSILNKPIIIDKPICLTLSLCPLKCKRYIIRNDCPTCECNPCIFDQPLFDISCGQGEQKCSLAGGLCKIHSWYDKCYCCPKENDGCCPSMPLDKVPADDPNILFPCLPQCYADDDFKKGQKCCGTCPPRCMNALIL